MSNNSNNSTTSNTVATLRLDSNNNIRLILHRTQMPHLLLALDSILATTRAAAKTFPL